MHGRGLLELWTWLFLLCVKLYVRLIIYLLRRAVFFDIPVLSMWLVYYYRVWQEDTAYLDCEED